MTDIIFESFINLFQSVVVTVFLIISLGCKDKYNKKYVSAAGIFTDVQFCDTERKCY